MAGAEAVIPIATAVLPSLIGAMSRGGGGMGPGGTPPFAETGQMRGMMGMGSREKSFPPELAALMAMLATSNSMRQNANNIPLGFGGPFS